MLTSGFMTWKFRKQSQAVNKTLFSNCGLHVGVRIPHQRQLLHHELPQTRLWNFRLHESRKFADHLNVIKLVLRGTLTNGRPDDDVLKEKCGRSIWYPSELDDNTTVTKLVHGRIVKCFRC